MKFSLKNVSGSTVLRGMLTLLSLLQVTLSTMGIEGGLAPDSAFGKLALCVAMAVVFLWSYWKNNSFTAAAQAADKLLEQMKEDESV